MAPTVIADEADVLLVDNDPLRAVINSGWTRGAGVLRCIGDDSTPHSFPTFCPKIVGMKGRKLPDTTLSRSIIVEMRRKRPGDKAEHFRSIDDAGLAELRQRALRWANDNGEKLDGAEPDMPPGFDCRLGDNWSLLLAIADHAGGDWRDRARKAAVRLAKVADATSIGVQLLTDIKGVFDGLPGADGDREPLERISSADLAAALGADMASPWAEWMGGKPITQAQTCARTETVRDCACQDQAIERRHVAGLRAIAVRRCLGSIPLAGNPTFKVEQWNKCDGC